MIENQEAIQQETPNVGQRIRALRERRGYSLRTLARRCKLSANAISLIEHGENSPTVSSLHELALALRVPITAFFMYETGKETILVRQNQRIISQSNMATMECLGSGLPNQQIEPFIMAIEPGGSNSPRTIAHTGEEFVFCLEGEIKCVIGNQTYSIKPGDSLLFLPTQPHIFYNETSELVKILFIFFTLVRETALRLHHMTN